MMNTTWLAAILVYSGASCLHGVRFYCEWLVLLLPLSYEHEATPQQYHHAP